MAKAIKQLTPEQLTALRAVPISKQVPNRVHVAMALAGVNGAELAAGIGLSASSVSDIRNGKYESLKHPTVQRFADFFGCYIEDLFPLNEAIAS